MRAAGFRPRRGTYERLMNALLDADDERCVAVLSDYKGSGEALSQIERRVRERFEGPRDALSGVGF